MSKITETAQTVLEKRYFIKGETEWSHLTKRVGRWFGKDEVEATLFRKTMDALDFLPNSPALMNAGTAINAYSACYVLPVEDSIESIYKFYGDAAKISKSGGGVGANYSSLRGAGTSVQSTDGVASGPLSFMKVQDVSTDTIKQGGRRRGANMGILMCDHEDIWDFVKVKDDPELLTNFNLSVGITDGFMEHVTREQTPASEWGTSKWDRLWDELITRAWNSAEPGVLFMDTIANANPVPHLGKLEATNPCLHPDSVIETVEGRIKIKDITKPTKVYTMEDDGSLGIRDASASWVSKKSAKTLTIEVRSGKSVTLTPDHKVRVRGKGWVQAKDLKVNDELVHLCRARRGVAYSGVKLTTEDNRAYQMEHRFIAEGVYGELNMTEDVHHINGDTYDNHIDNFEVLSHGEHSTLTRLQCSNDHQVRDKEGNFIATGITPKVIVPMPDALQSKLKNGQGAWVKSITVGETTDVYDMTVEGTHNMIANFLVVHNCGEQPLLPYESCTLGSINLSNHVVKKDSGHVGSKYIATVDHVKLRETVRTGVLFLNRILDASKMPIPECQEAMEKTRKIGLGIMGLHDMLIQLGLPYDSEEGRKVAGEVMKFISEEADKLSRELGASEGFFTGSYVDANFKDEFDREVLKFVDGVPSRRNACLTTIAPTGTLSMIADCSSGCEPYYAPVTIKEVLDGTKFTMLNKWLPKHYQEALDRNPGWVGEVILSPEDKLMFKGANEIHWSDHVKLQGMLQAHIDSSISKTINMPNDATVEDVKGAYELAYKLGCKGITVYRDGSRETQVLSTDGGGDVLEEEVGDSPEPRKLDLPDVAKATRYRVSVDGTKVYVMVTEGEEGEPLEIFVKFAYESDPVWNVLCRQLSLSLRHGVPLEDIVKQLDKSVVGVGDMSAKLSRILKRYTNGDTLPREDKSTILHDSAPRSSGRVSMTCPECDAALIHTGGCVQCNLCGWEKCS